MQTPASSGFNLTRWYFYADAESTKQAAWSVDRDALYVVRFFVKNWSRESQLSTSGGASGSSWKLFKNLCGVLARSIERYTVRGVTMLHVAKMTDQIGVLAPLWSLDRLGWMDTDEGSWIIDLVIRADDDQTIFKPELGVWTAEVAKALAGAGYQSPSVHVMGIVTLHCGPSTSVCRLNTPQDSTPEITAEVESYWMGMPDLIRVTLPKAELDAGKTEPHTELLDPYVDWSTKRSCIGYGGAQYAIGLHDHIGLYGELKPIFECSGTKETILDDIAKAVPKAAATVAGFSTSQKIVVGIFVLAGFVIGVKWRRMRV
ncbi:MAG: hypothetical protein WC683_02500 [bacterium]